MDWTMVANANGKIHRLQTILYLLLCRYEVDANTAGTKFKVEIKSGNKLCEKVMKEIRIELSCPSSKLEMDSLFSDAEARKYLANIINALDKEVR